MGHLPASELRPLAEIALNAKSLRQFSDDLDAAFSALLPAKYDNAVDFVTRINSDDMFERNANRAHASDRNEPGNSSKGKDNARDKNQ